jgi:hypothetical protein
MKKTGKFRHKKVGIGVALSAALVLVLFIASDAFGSVSASDTVALSAGQSLVYATITSIEGNEITYTKIDSDVAEELLKRQEESQKDETKKDESQTKDQSSGDHADAGMPSGGSMPSGTDSTDRSQQGEMTENASSDESTETSDAQSQPAMSPNMQSQGESVTAQIPVGTTVHTTTDTTTTFSRLRSGDFIKILLDTDADGDQVISEIWMLQ